MSHVDPELLALRALGESAGTKADEAHLLTCAQCRAEVDQIQSAVSVARGDGQQGGLVTPPDRVWTRIAAELGSEVGNAAHPVTSIQPAPGRAVAGPGTARIDQPADSAVADPASTGFGRPAQRVSWWRRPVAAGLAGLLIGVGAAIGIRQLASPASQVVASIALRPLPQSPQWKGAAGTALMERGTGGIQLSVTLRAPKRPGFYEVWLLARDGVKMHPLGDLNADHTGVFAMPPGVKLAYYSRIDVSLQPFNGSTLHSRVGVVRGSLP